MFRRTRETYATGYVCVLFIGTGRYIFHRVRTKWKVIQPSLPRLSGCDNKGAQASFQICVCEATESLVLVHDRIEIALESALLSKLRLRSGLLPRLQDYRMLEPKFR